MLRFYRGSIRCRQFISKSFVRKSGGAKVLLGMWTSVFNMVSKFYNLGGIQKEVPQICQAIKRLKCKFTLHRRKF